MEEHYVYGTPALRPFSRTMTEEDAKRIDPMGRIPGILAPNGMFSHVCECAEALGIREDREAEVPPGTREEDASVRDPFFPGET